MATKRHPYRGKFPGVGPRTIEELERIGIHSREELLIVGAEGAMSRVLQTHNGRQKGMCSCQAYTFEGIIRECLRYKIPDRRKKEIIAYVHTLRKEYTHA